MPISTKKICRVCGQDVSERKRTKDTSGNYYCDACYTSVANRTLSSQPSRPNQSALQTPKAACQNCGNALSADAAFCPRCGKDAPDNGVPIADQIDLTEAVHWVSMYAEAAGTIATIYRLAEGVETLAARGQQIESVEAERMLEVAGREERNANDMIAKATVQLRKFDRERLIGVREQMLKHSSVTDAAKAGLRLDPSGIFGPPGTPDAERTARVAETESLSGGYGKLAGGNSSPMYSSARSNDAEGFKIYVISCFLACVIAIPILWIVIFSQGPNFLGGWSFVVGIIASLILIGIAMHYRSYWLAACPKCGRWNALEAIDSEYLGSSMRSEDVDREEKHYAPTGEYLGKTVRQDSVLRTDHNYRMTYRCEFCHHVCAGIRTKTM